MTGIRPAFCLVNIFCSLLLAIAFFLFCCICTFLRASVFTHQCRLVIRLFCLVSDTLRIKLVFECLRFSLYPPTADCRAPDICVRLKRGSCSSAAVDGEAAEGGQCSLGWRETDNYPSCRSGQQGLCVFYKVNKFTRSYEVLRHYTVSWSSGLPESQSSSRWIPKRKILKQQPWTLLWTSNFLKTMMSSLI